LSGDTTLVDGNQSSCRRRLLRTCARHRHCCLPLVSVP
jgi:hypothetical protein